MRHSLDDEESNWLVPTGRVYSKYIYIPKQLHGKWMTFIELRWHENNIITKFHRNNQIINKSNCLIFAILGPCLISEDLNISDSSIQCGKRTQVTLMNLGHFLMRGISQKHQCHDLRDCKTIETDWAWTNYFYRIDSVEEVTLYVSGAGQWGIKCQRRNDVWQARRRDTRTEGWLGRHMMICKSLSKPKHVYNTHRCRIKVVKVSVL